MITRRPTSAHANSNVGANRPRACHRGQIRTPAPSALKEINGLLAFTPPARIPPVNCSASSSSIAAISAGVPISLIIPGDQRPEAGSIGFKDGCFCRLKRDACRQSLTDTGPARDLPDRLAAGVDPFGVCAAGGQLAAGGGAGEAECSSDVGWLLSVGYGRTDEAVATEPCSCSQTSRVSDRGLPIRGGDVARRYARCTTGYEPSTRTYTYGFARRFTSPERAVTAAPPG